MTVKKIAVLLSLAVTAGCSTTHVSWPEKEDKIDGVYSRQVAFLPYTTQGIDVAPTTNWYYGKTPGIRAYAAEGGVVYVSNSEDEKVSSPEKEHENSGKTELAQSEPLDKEPLSEEPKEPEAKSESGVNGYSAKGASKLSAKDPAYIDEHLINGAFIGSVSFPLDKSDKLYQSSLDDLNQFIESFDAEGSVVVLIGYTDDIGLDDYNIPLSEKRAEFVKQKIQEKHSNADVVVIGSGPSPRLADNRVSGGRETNRRVEIYLIQEGEK